MVKSLMILGSLIAAIMLIPTSAQAHTITGKQCLQYAISKQGPGQYQRYQACKRQARKHHRRHQCQGSMPLHLIASDIRVKGVLARRDQRRNITQALNIANKRKVPRSHFVALVAAATQEQLAHNHPYGHSSSVGFLQLLDIHEPDGIGHDWRMHLPNSVGWFLNGARKLDPKGQRHPGALADAVQRPRVRGGYNRWVPEARRTVAVFFRPCRRPLTRAAAVG